MSETEDRILIGSPEHRRYIRAWYAARMEEIMAAPKNRWGIDPYEWSGVVFMTYIEQALWHDIRCEGVVLYPQLPVGPYFLDFGNPKVKVCVECDGKAFHSSPEQRAADLARQKDLHSLGWAVYRLSGKQCLQDLEETEDEYGRATRELSPGQVLMREIARQYGISTRTVDA